MLVTQRDALRMQINAERMDSMRKPTKEQFEDYVRIRNSGVTNMWDTRTVCDLSSTGLTMDNCVFIMHNFSELVKEYNVDAQ